MQKYALNPFKSIQIPTGIIKYGLLIFVIGSLIGTYTTMYKTYDSLTPLVLIDLVLPQNTFEVNCNTFKEEYSAFMSPQTRNRPMALLYQAIPYYKLQSNLFYEANNELTGYFQIPASEEFISLETESLYVPKSPLLKQQEVSLNKLNDPTYLMKNFIMGGAEIKVDNALLARWDFKELAQKPLRLNETVKGPKVLIFHTHNREVYSDEKRGDKGVVGVGEKLEEVLENQYGIETLHVKDGFYIDEHNDSVTGAYERMEPVISNILKQYPSIQMCIDIHRDGINSSAKFLTTINEKSTAKIMLVNGLCLREDGEGNIVPMQDLKNEYVEDNLAFALQTQLQAFKYYPGFMRKMYFRAYRFSTHMKPLSLLVEVGNQNNTSEEAANAAEPLADIIAKVLEKD